MHEWIMHNAKNNKQFWTKTEKMKKIHNIELACYESMQQLQCQILQTFPKLNFNQPHTIILLVESKLITRYEPTSIM
jgi:hypothetical protein